MEVAICLFGFRIFEVVNGVARFLRRGDLTIKSKFSRPHLIPHPHFIVLKREPTPPKPLPGLKLLLHIIQQIAIPPIGGYHSFINWGDRPSKMGGLRPPLGVGR